MMMTKSKCIEFQTAILMKSLGLMTLLAAIGAASGWAQTPSAPTKRNPTNEELLSRYQKASQVEPVRKVVPAKTVEPPAPTPKRTILGSSDVLCYNGLVTLVPKGAIIQVPKNLADRLKYQPGAKLLSWSDFYALNRGWITTVEVSMAQAEGKSPLAEDTQKKIVKSGNLMIATYKGGLISVLPLKAPVETPTKTPKP